MVADRIGLAGIALRGTHTTTEPMQTLSIQEIISRYVSAREIESQLAMKVQSKYDVQAHYAACDATSRWAIEMINHPDWTIELADQFYPNSVGDIAYPVSC